jgi:acyl-CoA reductase-like NAD-dependent aldehyde dehydrogenase
MTTMNLPTQPTHYRHFINGKSTDGASAGRIPRRSPGHDVVVSTYPEGTTADAVAAIAAARHAFDAGPWLSTTGAEREAVLRKTAGLIRQHKMELGLIECLESGKPISQARDEMDWAAGIWDYAAALCRHLHGETTNTLGDGMLGMTLREPAGVCALITPWNFPLLIISQKLPFALAAGCTCVVKPSEFTSGTTVRLAGLLQQAGLPDGVCNVVTGYGDPVGQTFAESPDVDLISFTGSTAVGKKIAAASGSNLKKVALELGGNNPQLIFPDAELDAVVDAVVFGVYFNMGECCNSGSRILVHESIAEDLVARVIRAAQTIPVGDPLDEKVKIGAIINEKQEQKILQAIQSARQAGAVIPLGGERLAAGKGRFIQTTVLDRVRPEMNVAHEEIFGPVLSVIRFRSEEEALEMANSTLYGLSASVWTQDFDRALRLTRRLRAGTVWINTFMDGAPELPFGGYKQSGLGRELGPHAVLEFTETKTVTMRLGRYQPKWLK